MFILYRIVRILRKSRSACISMCYTLARNWYNSADVGQNLVWSSPYLKTQDSLASGNVTNAKLG